MYTEKDFELDIKKVCEQSFTEPTIELWRWFNFYKNGGRIDSLKQENEKLKERLKPLSESITSTFEYFKDNLDNWTREELLQRLYDLCNEDIKKDKKIDNVKEYLNNILTIAYNEEESYVSIAELEALQDIASGELK